MPPLLYPTDHGLYCEAGDFFVDAWRPVDKSVVTHAHSDHARWGCKSYLCSAAGENVLRERVGKDAAIESIPYGETTFINGVKISLHPAGHILGSAQVRIEHKGEVWVVSGDYKTVEDRTCLPFEPVRCHTFISESTFGMPIFQWEHEDEVFADINEWWRGNVERERVSVIFAYALGKAQRVISGLDASIGPILVHGAVDRFLPHYAAAGAKLPAAEKANVENAKLGRGKAMIIAPPSAAGTPWLKKFGPASLAFASGWMAIRGTRRRRALDRGFLISDHADWPGLLETIAATGAERVGVTHGYTGPMVKYLQEVRGLEAYAIPTRFVGEAAEDEEAEQTVEEQIAEEEGAGTRDQGPEALDDLDAGVAE